MDSRPQILTVEDIKLLVDAFYQRVQSDELLGPIFNERIQDRWPIHLEKMYRFWQTVLLEEYTYNGRPFPPHAHLPVGPEHFAHWLELFNKTVDQLFAGEKADEAKWRADKMATMFMAKIEYFRNNPLNIV
ncbi:group III truncated hemoglobin [Mucilaginibacter terrigena]|uniref:Group III truncated hemoglobin n=1 Tax=Mucilaginibacter terrigena TaxID=2492395 RepID=A0A4Q5LJ59_9SPHI|nr:group III truncated hemoglobin [Mucilaginibacter terrigena]RYU86491.1 group III truncated hemoglobin [Mucilaginibacter terrigena]